MDDLAQLSVERLTQMLADADRECQEARLQLAQAKVRRQRVVAAREAAKLAAYTRARGRSYERASASASRSFFEEESSRSTSSRSRGRGRVDFVDPYGPEVDQLVASHERLTGTRTTDGMRKYMARIWKKHGAASLEILDRLWNEESTRQDLLKRVLNEPSTNEPSDTPIQLEPEVDYPESAWSPSNEDEEASDADRVLWRPARPTGRPGIDG